jgi:hypothetical protein
MYVSGDDLGKDMGEVSGKEVSGRFSYIRHANFPTFFLSIYHITNIWRDKERCMED